MHTIKEWYCDRKAGASASITMNAFKAIDYMFSETKRNNVVLEFLICFRPLKKVTEEDIFNDN
ncbi:hypothetical protein BpHYR1_011661 [Brachionus plicatilis]|uniref:Uncharacterized protein n=1 Tax=Brachionus plicatilis TaxID=10195 RepID=A0A3M7S747_BRAPC|nr:hypothetical protein BpHYR1_011661 [Brachionus plicatilis]